MLVNSFVCRSVSASSTSVLVEFGELTDHRGSDSDFQLQVGRVSRDMNSVRILDAVGRDRDWDHWRFRPLQARGEGRGLSVVGIDHSSIPRSKLSMLASCMRDCESIWAGPMNSWVFMELKFTLIHKELFERSPRKAMWERSMPSRRAAITEDRRSSGEMGVSLG